MIELLGKQVYGAYIDETKKNLKIECGDQDRYYQTEADCCNLVWIEHISGIEAINDAKVLEVKIKAFQPIDNSNSYEDCEAKFFTLITDKGYFDVELRNAFDYPYAGDLKFIGSKCPADLHKDYKGTQEIEFSKVTEDF